MKTRNPGCLMCENMRSFGEWFSCRARTGKIERVDSYNRALLGGDHQGAYILIGCDFEIYNKHNTCKHFSRKQEDATC